MRNYLHLRRDNGKVERQGVDQPAAEIVAERGDIIVLKVPGHHYWIQRGGPDAYAPAEFQVWQFEEPGHEKGTDAWANLLVEFPARKPNR